MSLSPWRTRPKQQNEEDDDKDDRHRQRHQTSGRTNTQQEPAAEAEATAVGEKKGGIWKWKPMRALSHIGMQRLGCLFSVEVIAVQGLPASVNGLRLSVAVRKKETKDGAVQTMPSRVLQGCADFEETLFLRCHIYCSGGGSSGKQLKFEPRPFLISTVAVDAPELDFGKGTVDLSLLVKESMEKNLDGVRVRQWDRSFKLSGKAKGGEMILKLGFQIMEDGGVGIYNQADGVRSTSGRARESSSPFSRRMSKSAFSVTSPRVSTRLEPAMPAVPDGSSSLDYPGGAFTSGTPSVQRSEPEDQDLPEFEVVDKGVEEIQGAGGREQKNEEEEEEAPAGGGEETDDDDKSASSEVIVKEVVVPNQAQQRRLTELDSIAKQIEALESLMTRAGEDEAAGGKTAAELEAHGLDADEETLTREFLHMLDLEDGGKRHDSSVATATSPRGSDNGDDPAVCLVSDLGKGLGPVVQTKEGGYLAAVNAFNTEVSRKETPKLAMQISKPLVLRDQKNSASGFEIFQRMAAMGSEELCSNLLSLASMDDLMGKTAEQIAFEGVASAVISGRNKEGATSSAARSVAAVKNMAASLEAGRKERILTGIWNAGEEPVAAEEILAFTLQKIEAMALEALKIQADMAEEEAPFDIFTLAGKDDPNPPLASAIPVDDWAAGGIAPPAAAGVTILVIVQLRDPLRRYETVGAPMVALAQAAAAAGGGGQDDEVAATFKGSGEEGRRRLGRGEAAADCDAVAGGQRHGAAGEEGEGGAGERGQDLLWSMSSRVMAGMWLKPVRNPDVKFPRQP
ncbi:unnamed protein product [Spirodela intermedia]|uniref:C2 NT-type domain-containing protein n=1 Tax=Spirodela intermedia TaxID=51605 RepID=A0A7I8J4M1_SPIIN|nr:unnamed protein product [Spirodela intermedia]CAA6665020.1 unnamed protein product [Spirodela intermedia]